MVGGETKGETMSCCDTGACIEERPDPEPIEAPECPMCDDDGLFYSIAAGKLLPCPCKTERVK